MANTKTQSTTNQKKVQDFRVYQEELLSLSQPYSQARLAAWAEEARALHDSWNGLSQGWQANLEQMTTVSGSQFAEIAAQGQAAAGLLSQSWQQNLTDTSGSVDQWGVNFLKTQSTTNQKKVQDFRVYQEELLSLSQPYSQARLAAWAEEARALHDSWNGLSQSWQANLEQMTTVSGSQFAEMAAQGQAAAGLLSQSWQQNLTEISGSVDQWGVNFLNTFAKMAGAWGTSAGSQGGAGAGWSSLLGGVLDFGGIFHEGGIVEAHQGMVISPGTLMADEQLILAQKGEGVLPRESMARLGEKNFEALRTGKFDAGKGKTAPSLNVTIQVQALDASGVAGLDWDRVVQRHLMPALRQETDRRW
jgi:hypothetical protein